MCGIAGSINIQLTKENLSKMNHRGPDSMGLNEYHSNSNQIYLGQTRLSIIDLSDAGFQPMSDSSNKFTILMNGEIYNHEELRKELSEYQFKGHSDTETVLYYLTKFGISGVKKLNGIFAICFFDHQNSKLYLARDPFGIKPLYYFKKNNQLAFASEIRIITDIIGNQVIDEECLYNYLRIRFCPSPLTLQKGILKLEPGHYLEFDLTKENFLPIKKFYSYIPTKNQNIKFDEALEEYDFLVREGIKRQLMSDVPIAIMLSGGVDSALLAHLAQEISGNKFDTFSVGFNLNTGANELIDAAETAKWLGSNHHELILTEDNFKNNSSELIKMLEEPVGSQSLYPFYHLTEEINKKGFKVALSGQGVDEAMSGYKRYNFQNIFDEYATPTWKILKLVSPFIKNDKIRRGMNAISEKNRAKRYIESYSFFEKKQLKTIFKSADFLDGIYENKLLENLEEKAKIYDLNTKNGLDYMLMLDTRLALTDDLLLYTDKLSMQHSLEVRVPFLDIELMKFVETLPSEYKSNLKENKILHKKLAEKYLPKEIIYRKKKGFFIPRNEWYKSESGATFMNQIANDKSKFSELINKDSVIKMFNDHRAGKYNYEDQIYSIMNLYYYITNNQD